MKNSLPLFLVSSLLLGCNFEDTLETKFDEIFDKNQETKVKIATYNLSFDRNNFEDLLAQMQISPKEQTRLVTEYLNSTISADEKVMAEKIIQIRNVAAIIQINQPDVIMMAEFNNDGAGNNQLALNGFLQNYLAVAQSSEGAGGKANLSPIFYPFMETYATNTGLLSQYDLDNNGAVGQLPGDAWGFGFYHGQYAFALMSKYEIDKKNTRTFQTFKWKDMQGAEIPKITICSDATKIPTNMACGDNWYSEDEWQQVRLSSKNHVDAPIIIPTKNGNETLHLLMSHPTPPVFDTGKNKAQNAAEIAFWHDYVQGKEYFYDDAGKVGGLASTENFMIMGDLNLDPVAGDGISNVMQQLHDDPLINQRVSNGDYYPESLGAAEFAAEASKSHPFVERLTSTFGLAVDYALPSANLNVIGTGVYWPASVEKGRKLINDERIGQYGNGKDVSSDHRLIWSELSY